MNNNSSLSQSQDAPQATFEATSYSESGNSPHTSSSTVDIFSAVPIELVERNQWVLYRLVTRDGRPTKVPFQPSGQSAKVNDPLTWSPFQKCRETLAASNGYYSGLGYVFSAEDDFCG